VLKIDAYTAMFGVMFVYAGIVRLGTLKDPVRETGTVATVLIGVIGIAIGSAWLGAAVWYFWFYR